MKLIPTQSYVVVVPAPKAETSVGGVILTQEHRDDTNFGDVIAIGPNAPREMLKAHVVYLPYAGSEVTIAGKRYVCVKAEHILLILQ